MTPPPPLIADDDFPNNSYLTLRVIVLIISSSLGHKALLRFGYGKNSWNHYDVKAGRFTCPAVANCP